MVKIKISTHQPLCKWQRGQGSTIRTTECGLLSRS